MAKPKVTSPGCCIYCGQPNLTKEHIWGKWSRKLGPISDAKNTSHQVTRFANMDCSEPIWQGLGKLNRNGSTRSQQLRICCASCNNGWMSDNVNSAKPILERLHYGYWGEISQSDQEKLFRWIVQFVMSNEFNDPNTVVTTPKERKYFSINQNLSDSWLVAIGIADQRPLRYDPTLHRSFARRVFCGPPERAMISIFLFGSLAAFVFYSPTPVSDSVKRMVKDLGFTAIHPKNSKSITRPVNWAHTRETIAIVVDAITAAFLNTPK